ncbi:WD40 repeat domain-containing protein [Streptomyces sp. NPDC048269]|uniref:WD40 repeat domain-containing protein n=1 Tax=Streptomyces sp. NPDC048269 TaxID=3155753 RepID=UPI00342A9EA2
MAGGNITIRHPDGIRRTVGPGDDIACPYPGLQPFEAGQERWFHGRDEVVHLVCQRLDARVRNGGPLVLIGPSGAGKSSLLAAGVLPALKQGRVQAEGSRHWPRLLLTPTEHPAVALAETAGFVNVPETAAAWRADPGQCLTDLHRLAVGKGDRAEDGGHRPPGLVVVVDQFEEVFTLCTEESEREWFVDLLDRLARPPSPRAQAPSVLVVLGVRADFYTACVDRPQLREALRAEPVLLDPMTEAELRQAILAPARDVGLEIEDGLVELLLADLGSVGPAAGPDGERATGTYAGRLPLLAHALRATHGTRSNNLLTVDGYRTTGGIHQAIANTAEGIFGKLPPTVHDVPEVARSVFMRLVVVGRDADDARRHIPYDELLRASARPDLAAQVISEFTRGRLLTLDRDSVAITHEALMRAWPRLRGWIEQDRAGHLVRQDLEEAASAWTRANRDPGLLHRGNRLEAARNWASGRENEVTDGMRAFLGASGQRERRRRVRRRTTWTVLTTLTLLASVAAGFALRQDARARASATEALRERDQAITARVTAEALRLAPADPSLAAQLSLVAYRMAPDADAASRLLSTQNTPLATRLPGTTASLHTVAYSPDGNTLATGTVYENTVRLWDVRDPGRPRTLVPRLPMDSAVDSVLSVAFSPDGRTLAVAGHTGDHTRNSWAGGGFVDLWNVTDPEHPSALGRPVSTDLTSVTSVAFSPDGHTLAAAVFGEISLWNVTRPAAATPLGEVPGASAKISSVGFAPDGRTLAVGGAAGVRLWNVSRPEAPASLGQPLTGSGSEVTSVAFSPDGQTIAAGSADNTVHRWNLADPQHPSSPGPPLTGPTSSVTSVAFSPDGQTIAGGSADNTVHRWNVALPQRPYSLGLPLAGPSNSVMSVAFSPDGRRLAAGNADGAVDLWSLPATVLIGAGGNVTSVAFAADGRTLAAGNQNGTVSMWNTTDRNRPTPLGPPITGPGGPVLSVRFGPDGHTLAVGGRDGTVSLWNTADPGHPASLGQPLTGPRGPVHAMAFSPDGRTLAAAGDDPSGTIQLWDVTKPSAPQPMASGVGDGTRSVWSLAFAADGRTVAVGGDVSNGKVGVWRMSDSRLVRLGQPLGQPDGTSASLEFSPDGHTLAVGNSAGTVNLWNMTDPHHPASRGKPLAVAAGPITSVAFSPDGRTLAVGGLSSNGTVSRWDMTDPDRPSPLGQPLPLTTGPVHAVTFAPDGHTLAVTSDDGVVGVWSLTVDEAIRRICAGSTGALGPHQWSRFIPQLPYAPPCPDSGGTGSLPQASRPSR